METSFTPLWNELCSLESSGFRDVMGSIPFDVSPSLTIFRTSERQHSFTDHLMTGISAMFVVILMIYKY